MICKVELLIIVTYVWESRLELLIYGWTNWRKSREIGLRNNFSWKSKEKQLDKMELYLPLLQSFLGLHEGSINGENKQAIKSSNSWSPIK